MSVVERLEFTCPDCDPDTVPVNHGRYVRYSDFASLQAEVERWVTNAKDARSVISMIRGIIGEMFGPVIESEEATLLRGPEPKHDGQAILEALARIRDRVEAPEAKLWEGAEPVAYRWQEHYNKEREDRWHLEKVLPKFDYDVEVKPLYLHPTTEQTDARSGVNAEVVAALEELEQAGHLVLCGLNARIDAAPSTAKPVFNGVVDLHDALHHARSALQAQAAALGAGEWVLVPRNIFNDVAWEAAGEPVKWKDIRHAFSMLLVGKVLNDHGQWVVSPTPTELTEETEICPDCNGSGEYADWGGTCPRCGGTGGIPASPLA